MEIIINAKYNIGDIVYVADSYHGFYPIDQPGVIENILINGDINKVHIMYMVEQDIFITSVPEERIFPTYEECKKWCIEQNKRKEI